MSALPPKADIRTRRLCACHCFSVAGVTWAQVQSAEYADKPDNSAGRTVTPETKGQLQPQGQTGAITTTTGGAPASSPQGETPAGMQAAPEGSSKTTVAPEKNTK